MQAALCASCGGALDLDRVRDDRLECTFCGTWTLFRGASRDATLPLLQVPSLDAEALEADTRAWLQRRNLPVQGAFEAEPGLSTYVVREVRVERGGPSQVMFLSTPPWYSRIGRHRVGRKVSGDGPATLVLPIDQVREPWPGPPPDGVARALENLGAEVELELRQAGHAPHFMLLWEGEPEVVAVRTVTYRFTLDADPAKFQGRTDDGRYHLLVTAHDGTVIGKRLPTRKTVIPKAPFVVLGVLIVLVVVVIGLAVAVPVLGVFLSMFAGLLAGVLAAVLG